MKPMKLSGICLLFMFYSVSVSAQQTVPLNEPDYNKPSLFSDLPDKIPVDITELKTLIAGKTAVGKDVQFRTPASKLNEFRGRIVSYTSKYDNKLNSIVVRCSEFNGATLTLSAWVQEDGSVIYNGRIMSFQSGDLYQLEKQGDTYSFVKKKYYDLINE